STTASRPPSTPCGAESSRSSGSGRANVVRAEAERRQQLAEPRKVAVGGREATAEVRELGVLRLAGLCELRRHLGDTPLEPPPLGLERERPRVAGGQGVLDSVDARGILAPPRSVEQSADLFENHGQGDRFGPLRQVSRQPASTTWAARTIFLRREAHLLDSTGSRSKNGWRLSRRLVAAVCIAVALVAPASTGARTSQQSPLQRSLA